MSLFSCLFMPSLLLTLMPVSVQWALELMTILQPFSLCCFLVSFLAYLRLFPTLSFVESSSRLYLHCLCIDWQISLFGCQPKQPFFIRPLFEVSSNLRKCFCWVWSKAKFELPSESALWTKLGPIKGSNQRFFEVSSDQSWVKLKSSSISIRSKESNLLVGSA